MKTTDLWDLQDLTGLALLLGTRIGAVHLQRQMRTGAVVVGETTLQQAAEMLVTHHDDVVEKITADAADQTLDVRRLPGCASQPPTSEKSPDWRVV